MAKRSSARNSRVFTISFPEDLASQVESVAKEESRNISELFREAFRAYRRERINSTLERIRSEAEKRGPIPYTEKDVEALVREVRRERSYRSRRKKMIA